MATDEIIYRRLQEHMNRMPVGFPKSETGADIRILKQLFTEEEARVALELSMLPETIDRIYPRIKDMGYTKEQAEDMLNSMYKKGLVLGGKLLPKKGGKTQYSKVQFAIGLFELQLNQLKKEVAADMSEYSNTFKDEFFMKGRPVQMRTIPIGKSIKIENITATYDDIRKIISNAKDPIVINNCVCRENKDKEGKPCKNSKERETCIALGTMAKNSIEMGNGRVVSKEEVLTMLDKFEEIGFVLQPENNQNPQFVCCCCGCCCGVLTMAKHFHRPTEFYSSNYYAVVDPGKCNGAGTCVHRCQMGAITLKENRAVVNLDRCIGCGLCTTTCKAGAIALKTRDKIKVPPKNHAELYQQILMKKLGPVKTIGVVAKYMLGYKV
ncbi:MAG TPA: 4Fe-4S binding protein [Spirochaetota bacterium]|nr:4Fe-4S binding protein [Spirochaetota bacterium]